MIRVNGFGSRNLVLGTDPAWHDLVNDTDQYMPTGWAVVEYGKELLATSKVENGTYIINSSTINSSFQNTFVLPGSYDGMVKISGTITANIGSSVDDYGRGSSMRIGLFTLPESISYNIINIPRGKEARSVEQNFEYIIDFSQIQQGNLFLDCEVTSDELDSWHVTFSNFQVYKL